MTSNNINYPLDRPTPRVTHSNSPLMPPRLPHISNNKATHSSISTVRIIKLRVGALRLRIRNNRILDNLVSQA